ncbi:glycan metabolism protein [Pedobacter psychrophilus]|uniref:Glycan metabolism protein n=1 Tax=Pedobacter psychrophilus TaxID=1826909 RepID=A0A179DBM9_9SPHI|nr:RagB/SusD family nutrient uptake outer membrane protein [Pedobacter psychrophilus]OAQ38437.1 glycan metabolism protein [Pedobacter psychrophilus]
MKANYINKIILAVLLFGLVSCDSELNFEPRQSIDATTALETAQDIESAVVGAYAIMGGGSLYGTNLNVVPELLASDTYFSWFGTFQSYRQIALKTMDANNAEASRTWINAYRAINVANTILANIDKISAGATKDRLTGEAYFIRGSMFFELVRLYGLPFSAGNTTTNLGVPINLIATTDDKLASSLGARKTVAEVYTQVIADLNQAVTLIPNSNPTRATKFSALAMLSRVYLQQGNYTAARAAADNVITNSGKSLTGTVGAPFLNKNSSESLFEIQQNDQNNAGTSNDGLATFYASLQGIGRADIRILASFRNLYEATDKRRSDLIYSAVGARAGSTRYHTGKWIAFGSNILVIRLSEMYLTRAECNLRLSLPFVGDSPTNDYNLVRNRAGATPALLVSSVQTILNERVLELAFEGSRIHDLKRVKVSTGTFPYDSPKLVLPIPRREIDANASLIQNPGYN